MDNYNWIMAKYVWRCISLNIYPNSQVHGANMGPFWGQQDPGGPHVGPMNFAIWVVMAAHNVTVYIRSWIMDIHNCIMDIHRYHELWMSIIEKVISMIEFWIPMIAHIDYG